MTPEERRIRRNQTKAESKRRIRNDRKAFVLMYLQANPCAVCGETDPVVLDFDHLGDKTAAIALMINQCQPLVKIEAEMKKCQVLCSNCHRRKTAKQLGWWADFVLPERIELP